MRIYSFAWRVVDVEPSFACARLGCCLDSSGLARSSRAHTLLAAYFDHAAFSAMLSTAMLIVLKQQLVREGAHVTIVARRQGVLDGKNVLSVVLPARVCDREIFIAVAFVALCPPASQACTLVLSVCIFCREDWGSVAVGAARVPPGEQ